MKWISDLKELLFPRYCKVCGQRLMKSEEHLCLGCLLELPRTHYEQQPENVLMQHFMEWPEVVRATTYFYYYKEVFLLFNDQAFFTFLCQKVVFFLGMFFAIFH